MARDAEQLLRAARDELYLARALVAGLRNRTKTDTAALAESEQRIGGLIDEIEGRLNGSSRPRRPKEDEQNHLAEARH